MAQSKKEIKDKTSIKKIPPKQEKRVESSEDEVLDTNESIKYVGSKLWFQLRKRLHLTTEEEEVQEQKKRKNNVVFSIGGIKIEK